MVIYLLLNSKFENFTKTNFTLILLTLITIFLSGERMAFLLCSFYLFFFFIFLFKKIVFRDFIIFLTFFFITFFISLNSYDRLKARYDFFQYIADIASSPKELRQSVTQYNYYDLFKLELMFGKLTKYLESELGTTETRVKIFTL